MDPNIDFLSWAIGFVLDDDMQLGITSVVQIGTCAIC